jgi:hypothetical protein
MAKGQELKADFAVFFFSKILCASALPYFSAIHAGNHARTSSLAADMSFTTLCLTWFIVQLDKHLHKLFQMPDDV